jgi:RNA polymerase sigma-70 factor (ECF subfamily)
MAYARRAWIIPAAKKIALSAIAGNIPGHPRVFMPMEAPAPDVPTFDRLMLPHLDAAHNLARWLLRNDQDAEDAVQESCLRAWRAFDRFRGGDARAWLLTIVRNVCYTHLRQVRREPALEEFDESAHSSTETPGDTNATAWREIKGQQLRDALEKLPAEFREVIVLAELECLSYREIATVAAIPLGTVMSRLARARQKLAGELRGATGKESSHGL